MPRAFLYSCALFVAVVSPAGFGQQIPFQNNPPDATAATSGDQSYVGIDVLSDTGGVDLGPYMKEISALIHKNWAPLIPPEAKPPQSRQGQTLIRFTILPNGKIGSAMFLDGSTHDDLINRSCWRAITLTDQFPPLPSGMESKPLELRIHFYVNTQPAGASSTSIQR